jgi:predicted nucleic acid-binding protein
MQIPAPSFIDSNVLLYLLSANSQKADLAEAVMRKRGVINVQVLNEITHVMRRKFSMPWEEINEVLTIIRLVCQVEPLTTEIHDSGRKIAERYQLGLYDAMTVAAAIAAKCETLYSEDMQDRLMINHQLIIRNPFV